MRGGDQILLGPCHVIEIVVHRHGSGYEGPILFAQNILDPTTILLVVYFRYTAQKQTLRPTKSTLTSDHPVH